MKKLKELNKYLSNTGFLVESDMINNLIKISENNYGAVFKKIIEVLDQNFSKININSEESSYNQQHIRIVAKRYFTKKTKEGAEFYCNQDLLIRLSFPSEYQDNIICFVKSTLSCPGTLNGDFESEASESISKEQRKIFSGQVAYEIKDMIISISDSQFSELLEFVNI